MIQIEQMFVRGRMDNMSIEKEKLQALNQALGKIEKDFGKGSVMRLGEATSMNIDVISTGSIGLDIAVGIGGLPKGRSRIFR